MGRIIGKLNELWALVGAVNATRGANSKGSTDGVEWAVVDEEGLNQIVQVWDSAGHELDQGESYRAFTDSKRRASGSYTSDADNSKGPERH